MSTEVPHKDTSHLERPFGANKFGIIAEKFARFFGTPQFIITQTVLIVVWIAVNALGIVKFDLFPFILLNLLFSTQAAYAAPLILLAQTRQADREKTESYTEYQHREEIAQLHTDLLEKNTEITETVAELTQELHDHIVGEQKNSK